MERDTTNAAGIAFVAPGGLALWVKRSGAGDHAGTWCFPGGGIEDGEKPQNAARREAFEEVGIDYDGRLEAAGETKIPGSTGIYTTFLARIEQPFAPTINDENAGYAWLPLDDPPTPLHPGLAAGFAADEDFKESDHPRDDDGKFGSGGGGGSGGAAANSAGESEGKEAGKGAKKKGASSPEKLKEMWEDKPKTAVRALRKGKFDDQSAVIEPVEDGRYKIENAIGEIENAQETIAQITPEMRAEAEENGEYYEADDELDQAQIDAASSAGDMRKGLVKLAAKTGALLGLDAPADRGLLDNPAALKLDEAKVIEQSVVRRQSADGETIFGIDDYAESVQDAVEALDSALYDWENDDDADYDDVINATDDLKDKLEQFHSAILMAIRDVDTHLDAAHERESEESEDEPESEAKDEAPAFDQALAFDRATISLRVGGSMLRPGLAFDRATVRSYDVDNRLRVAATNISKANICPYVGREIPGWEGLELDPDKVYQLFRDPDELEKAAPTFNNLPLLSKHVAVNADDHQPELVIGATGSDANFVSPYLRNSLIIWERKAIDGVEDESKKELSSAYRYRADMTPGEFMGMRYDGVMRDIVGNHVALVKEGRAGTDVVVGDSKETLEMAGKQTLRTALTVGAVAAYLLPRLSPKAGKINFEGALDGLTVDNFASRKRTMIAAVTKATKGKLAHDASIDGLAAVLDMIDSGKMTKDADPDPMPKKEEEVVDEPLSVDAEAVPNFLKGKLSEDDYKACMDMMKKGAAKDADPKLAQLGAAGDADEDEDEEAKAAKAAKDGAEPPPFEGKPVTKGAMDAAIAGAVKAATETANKTQKGIRDAEKAVRPWVGELAIAFDSAEAVYRHALGMLGVTHKDIHASALPHVLAVQTKPGSGRSMPAVAMDEGQASDFKTRFPEAARLQAQ